jgi:lipopolysaccharide/colanic/teichoic acid biosynthesis glycosyltransferase
MSEEAMRNERVVQVATRLNLAGVHVRDLRTFYEHEFHKVAVSELSASWFLFDIAEIHRQRLYGRVKRILEVVVAASLLALSAPLWPLVAAGIRLSSPGTIFFRQERVGKDARRVWLRKFRTMHPEPGGEHGVWLAADEQRIFPLGRMLRRMRIDELPQLWNVVRGDLSLVGPRPEQPAIVERLQRVHPFYAARHCVRPGLTGWAQVSHGYGGSDEGAIVKLQYDLHYIKRQSLWIDATIMAATARAVFMATGE